MQEVPKATDVHTSDADEVLTTLRRTFGVVGMRSDLRQTLALQMRSVSGAAVQTVRWKLDGRCGGELDRESGAEPAYVAGIVHGGVAAVRAGDEIVDTAQPYLCPDVFDFDLAHARISNLAFDRTHLQRHARAMTGDDRLRFGFTGTSPVTADAGAFWAGTVMYVTRAMAAMVDQPETALAQTAIADLAASVLLRTFPNTALDAERGAGRASSAAVRRAVSFIDGNLDHPITVPDIASAARLSLRGIHAAFQRELELTPMAYVRRARLAALRDELLAASPDGADPARMAARWGFPQYGRLRRQYRSAFGEGPLDTLRR